MLQKLVLLAASLVTALVIVGGLAVAGFGPAHRADAIQVVDATAAVDTPAPAPVQVDTVYLTPEATPRDITVTEVRVATRGDGEHENEHEGNDD